MNPKNKTTKKMKTKTAKKAVEETADAKIPKSKKNTTIVKEEDSQEKEPAKKSKKVAKKNGVNKKKSGAKKKEAKKDKVVKPIDVAPQKKQTNKVTKLKVWMMEHRINQKELAKNTSLSTNTINRLVNNGRATKSVVKLVSYELGISVDVVMELLKFSEPING